VSLSLFAIIFSNEVVDSVRLNLEATSEYWFSFVKYAGYAVAIGCAMEAPETFVLMKRWWLLRFRDIEREDTKEDKKRWIVPLAAIGLFIIVIGIIVETYCEGKVSDIDAAIRGHESDVLSAAEAKTALADNKACDAETKAGELEKVAAQLRKDAEAERLARAQIEASVAWRRLSDQQKSDIGARLRGRRDSQVVSVWFLSADAEGSNFAADIAEMLRNANLRVLPPRPMAPQMQGKGVTTADPIDRWMTGVEVESTADTASLSLADALVKELNAAGFDAQTFGTSNDAPKALEKDLGPNIVLSVAPRPKGPQGEYKLLQAEREAKQKKKSTTQ
jgi:hypothetical protein